MKNILITSSLLVTALCMNLQIRQATGTVWFDDLEVIPMGEAKPVSKF